MSVKWAGQTWKVKLTREAIGGDDGPRTFLGQGDEATNVIVIDGTMPRSRQEEVLLHELIHQVAADIPEHVVTALGKNLYGVLAENGLLVRDLMGKVSDGLTTVAEMEALNERSQANGGIAIMGPHRETPGIVYQAPRTDIQSLILSKERFKTKASANAWVREHDFKIKPGAPDETENSWRYRQREPSEFQAGSFRTITLTDGVRAIIGRPKQQ